MKKFGEKNVDTIINLVINNFLYLHIEDHFYISCSFQIANSLDSNTCYFDINESRYDINKYIEEEKNFFNSFHLSIEFVDFVDMYDIHISSDNNIQIVLCKNGHSLREFKITENDLINENGLETLLTAFFNDFKTIFNKDPLISPIVIKNKIKNFN